MYKGSRAKKMLRLVNSHEDNYNFASEQNDNVQIADHTPALVEECLPIANSDQSATPVLQSPERNIADNSFLEDDADHTPALVEECLPIASSDQSATPVLQSPERNIADNSFLEDDDDSVKDPNYKSSSSSRSSSSCGSCSSSGSSCSSTTASSPHTAVNTTMSIHIVHSTHTQNMVDTESSNKENDSLLHNENIILESIGTEIQEMSQNHDETVENDITLTTEDDKTKKSSRKRLARVDEWLSNKAKKLRNTGQEYVSRSKLKKIVPARTLKPACGITCKMQCSSKVDEDNRKAIFAKYWELGDVTLQRNFISNCTKVIKPAIRFSGKEKPRNYNNAYYFNINASDVRVCKKFFMATLDINDRVVRTVIQKKELGFVELDKRGKHGNHKKVDETIKQSVRDHINSIPRIDSHYTRKTSSREFIDGGNLKIIDIKVIKMIQGEPSKCFVKYSYNDNEFSEVEISRKKNLQSIALLLKKAYRSKPKIKENKLRDLISLVESNHIPNFYGSFYRHL